MNCFAIYLSIYRPISAASFTLECSILYVVNHGVYFLMLVVPTSRHAMNK